MIGVKEDVVGSDEKYFLPMTQVKEDNYVVLMIQR